MIFNVSTHDAWIIDICYDLFITPGVIKYTTVNQFFTPDIEFREQWIASIQPLPY